MIAAPARQFSAVITGEGQFGLAVEGRLDQTLEAIASAFDGAALEAVGQVAARAKGVMRADMRATGFRNAGRLANTWRSNVWLRSKRDPAVGPDASVWSAAPAIVAAFDDGGAIRSPSGGWLAIPVGEGLRVYRSSRLARNRQRDSFGRFRAEAAWPDTVAKRMGGELSFVARPGARTGVILLTRARARGRAAQPIVIGALVRETSPGRRMRGRALLNGLLRSGAEEIDRLFLDAYERRARGGAPAKSVRDELAVARRIAP